MSKHIADIDLSIKLDVKGQDSIAEANKAINEIRETAKKPIKLSMSTLELNNQLKTVQKTAMVTAKTLQDIAMPKDLSSAKLQKETIGNQIEAATKNFNKAKTKEANLYEDSLSKAYTKYAENATKHNALNFTTTMDALYDQGIEYGAQRVIKGTQKTFDELGKIYWDALDNFDINAEDEGYQNKVKEKSANFDELADTLAARTDLYRNEMNTLKSIQKDLDTEIGRYEAAENIALEEAKRRQAELEEVQNKNDQLAKKSSQNGSEAQVISKAELEKKIKEKQDLVNRLNSKYPVGIDETVEAFKNVRNLRNNENRSEFITKFNKTDPELWKSFKTDEKIGRKIITSEMIQDFAQKIPEKLFDTKVYDKVANELEAKIQESLQTGQKALAELQSTFQKQYGTDGLFGDETSKGQIQTLYKQLQDLLSSESVKINIETKPTIEELKEQIMALSKDSIPLTFDVENLASKIEEMQKNTSFNDFGKSIESMGEAVQRFPEAFKNVDSIIKPSLESFSELRDMTTEIKSNFKQIGVSTIKDAEDVYKVTKKKKKTKSTASKNAETVKEPSEKQLREEAWQKAIKASKLEGVTSKELGNNKNGLYSFNQEIATAQGGIKTLRYEFENLEDVLTQEGKFKPDFLESAKDVTSKKAINDNYYKAVKLAQEKDSSLNLKSTNVSSKAGINQITISWEEATGALHKYKVEVEELSSLYGQDGALSLNKVKQFGVDSLKTTELLKNFKLAAKETSLKEYSDIDITSLKKAADGVYTLTASWTEATGAVKQYQVQTSDLSSLIKRNGNLNIQSIKENGHEVLSNKQILENLNKAAKATDLKKFKDISFSNLSQNAEGINEITASWVNAKGEAQKYKLIVEDINSLMTKAGTINQSTLNNSKQPYVLNQQQLDRLDKIKNSEALSDKFNEENIVNSIIDNALYYKGRGTKKDPNITVKDRIKTLREEMQKTIKSLEGGDIYNEAEANKKLVSLSKKQKDIDDFYKKYGKGEGFFQAIDKDKVNDIRAITSAVQECVEAQVKLKKTGKDGSMTFEFVKDGQVQEVKAKVKQIKDAMNDINYLDIGKPSSDKVYESYGEKWLTGLRGKIGSLAQYLTGMNAVLSVYNKAKEGFSFAKEMNSSLTTINQTMSVTQDQMNALGQGSIDVGRQLGVDAKNVMNAAEIYANANDTAKGVLDKAQASILLSNASGADTSTTSDQIQGVNDSSYVQ